MKSFNQDCKEMGTTSNNIEVVPNYDVQHYEPLAPNVIPFQLLDKSSKRLTDVYFLLHPDEADFVDMDNANRYFNSQTSRVSNSTNLTDEQLLASINSRYHSSFQDIHNLLISLDDKENELSQSIKKEMESDKKLNELFERYRNYKNSLSNNQNTV